MDAKTAFEKRRSAVEALRAFVDSVGDREFSAEENATYERMNADIDACEAMVERAFRNEELEKRSAELDALVGIQHDRGERSEDDGLTPIEREARSLFLPETRTVDFAANVADLRNIERRDLLAGTATDGAELVPTTLFGQLYVQLRDGATSMFSLSRQVITPAGEQIDFPTVTAFSTATLVGEAGPILESDPQFGTVPLNAYKYALAIQVSHELDADQAVPGALPWVVDQAVDGIRRGVGADLIAADGTNRPKGILEGTNTQTIPGIVGPADADILIDAQHDIIEPYRAGAVWLFNDATIKGIRKLKDQDDQYIWQPGLTAGAPDRLLGAPVYTDAAVELPGSLKRIGVYGNIQRGYVTRTVANIRAERSTDYAFLNDLVTWRFLGRFDGEIIDNNAFTVLKNAIS
jgi:HK97 family phage major capsid protein